MFIPDPNFSLPYPGSRVKKVPGPGSGSGSKNGSPNPYLDFLPNPRSGIQEKTTDPGSATLKFYVKVADLTRSSKTLNSNKNCTYLVLKIFDKYRRAFLLYLDFAVCFPCHYTTSRHFFEAAHDYKKKRFNKKKELSQQIRCNGFEIRKKGIISAQS